MNTSRSVAIFSVFILRINVGVCATVGGRMDRLMTGRLASAVDFGAGRAWNSYSSTCGDCGGCKNNHCLKPNLTLV